MSPEREKLRAARRARIDGASAPFTRGSRATGTGGSGRPMPAVPKKKVAAKAPPRPKAMSPETKAATRAERRARIGSASAPLTRGSRATGTGGSRATPKPATAKKKVAAKPSKSFRFEDSRATPKPSKSFRFEDSRATPKPATAKKKVATKKKVAAKPSFRSAYAAARKKYGAGTGGDTFTWNGKKYSVASKDDLKKGRAKKTKQGYKMIKKS